ncbi:MAG: TSUP family transporter [Terriglobales bacterium]|jgi:uncharacterized membrane protein YfcA
MLLFLFLLVGIGIGIFSGLVGIGGGILIVPALVYAFKMSQHKAQGTSLGALLLPIGVLAFWKYYQAGNVDVKAAITIALGFALGGYLGGTWAQHISDITLRRGFAAVLICLGVRMFWP